MLREQGRNTSKLQVIGPVEAGLSEGVASSSVKLIKHKHSIKAPITAFKFCHLVLITSHSTSSMDQNNVY